MDRTQIIFIALIASSATLLASCGPGKTCKEKSPGSFATFLDDEWRSYCDSYQKHIESPGEYPMPELAEFLGNHPAKVKQLEKDLYQHDKYESCFASPKAELELRSLQTCLQDDDTSDLQVVNSFSAVGDPWLEEQKLNLAAIVPRVSDAEREAKRQKTKIAEAFEFQRPVEGEAWKQLAVELKSIDLALQPLEALDSDFSTVRENAAGHKALSRLIEDSFAPEIATIAADAGSLRERVDGLQNTATFLEWATYSAGKKCPESIKKSAKEQKIAKKILTSKNAEVAGGGARVLSVVRKDTSGDTDYERFDGVICGERPAEKQFSGPKLCGQYRWVIEREKAKDERKFGDWILKSFEESGPEGGTDCGLKKK